MIILPYPHKSLWPNGRAHHLTVAREKAKHKQWAYFATKEAFPSITSVPAWEELLPVHVTVHGKPKGQMPDRDNCVAAAKAYLDGIALGLGINDRHFAAPTVSFAPERTSQFIVRIGT